MFYRGSQLEDDLKKLTNEVHKSDYEKTVEPFKNRIQDLQKELFDIKKDVEAIYSASRKLIESIEQDYIKLIVCTNEPKAYYGSPPELENVKYQHISIPVKQDVTECFLRDIAYFRDKYKEAGWLDD